jgi:hypothetical protein
MLKQAAFATSLGVFCTLLVVSTSLNRPAFAQAAALRVGAHVEAFTYTRDGSGKNAWRKGVVTEVFQWGAHVRMDDDNEIVTVGKWNLRGIGTANVAQRSAPTATHVAGTAPKPAGQVGAAAAAAIANAPRPQAAAARGAVAVAPGEYNCVSATRGIAIGGQSRMTIQPGGSYVDHLGVRGSYAYDAGQQLIRFRGGEKDGERASYNPGPPRPVIHILSPSNRYAFDCEHA